MWGSGCEVRTLYTLQKPVRKRFPRNPRNVTYFDVWEIDFADLSSLSKYNDEYKYFLNVIDIFPRYAWIVTLKDKTCAWNTTLKSLFCDRKPITIQSDKRTQFVNATIQQFLKRQGSNLYTTHNPNKKTSIIERFKRIVKNKHV